MQQELLIDFDFNSSTPLWRQLRDGLAEMAGSGELPAGYRLPPVRVLASDLELAPGTVARVYRDLEATGIVQTEGRLGTFISTDAREVRDENERIEILTEAAEGLVNAAHQVGASEKEAKALFVKLFRSS